VKPSVTQRVLLTALVAVSSWVGAAAIPARAGSGTISGTVFQDPNRNGVRDAGEAAWEGHQLYLFDGAGAYRATTTSDSSGRYAFAPVADGDYTVSYASPSWWAIRDAWVPTTGSIRPTRTVRSTGGATVDFGWRTIVRSTDVAAPLSTYTGPSGLRVESFDDVVGAREIHDAVVLGQVGAEASHVTIRFDFGPDSSTVAGWQGSPGSYSNYNAICYDNYVSWLDGGDQGVSHEYGHAWSLYYDTIVRQEGTLASYLNARGLGGDPRVNTSYAWGARELVAEDYRQLLGSPNGRLATQMNREIPPAADVPGLRDFLATTFTTSPAGDPAPPPPPEPVALTVSTPVVSPTPVVKSAAVSTTLSTTATVTFEIRDAGGALVRTLLSSAARSAGSVKVSWDRKDSAGRRVRTGTYVAEVRAVAADGRSARSSTAFQVS
jgi:hypothetical protein